MKSIQSRWVAVIVAFVGVIAVSHLACDNAQLNSEQFGSGVLGPPISGAVFTTDSTCTGVDLNIYESKDDVYINGGPQNQSGAAGLPDGSYYVKVTEPNGTLLGTSIGAGDETPVEVVDGEFVDCYQLSAILIKASDSSAGYDDTTNNGGEYKVWVSNSSGFENNSSKTDNFKVVVESGGEGNNPGLAGHKFYDHNVNGVFDDDEDGVSGVRINVTINGTLLDPSSQGFTTTTGFTGGWSIPNLTPGATFEVCEVVPETGFDQFHWIQTAPEENASEDRCYTGVVPDSGTISNLDFGNACLCIPTAGRTTVFWASNLGNSVLNNHDPDWRTLLNDLSLRTDAGANFEVSAAAFATAFNGFTGWLNAANTTNMAYALSVQLAAFQLNIEYIGISHGDTILLSEDQADCYGAPTASTSELIDAANAALAADGITPAGDPNRVLQECLKNILEDVNNNMLRAVMGNQCVSSY